MRSVRLKSGDGAFDRTEPLPAAAEGEITQAVTFLGLPTLGKRYSLAVLEDESDAEERAVFSDLSVTEIVEAIKRDRETLVEAEPDPDERTAKLDEIDKEGDSGVAVA